MGRPLGHLARALRWHPRRRLLGLLRHRRGDAVRLRVAGQPAGQELRAWRPRRPPHHQAQLPPAHEGLPRRRVDADAAARPGRRAHALVHLLRVPLAVHRHRRPRARPPAPRQPQVPARRRLRGVRVRRRPRGRGVHRRHRLGDRRGATSSGRTASASRRSPRTRSSSCMFLIIARHRLLHRGAAHRRARPARLREVVVRRVPALVAVRRLVGEQPAGRAHAGCGASTSLRSWRS